jgi:hypothetical protein
MLQYVDVTRRHGMTRKYVLAYHLVRFCLIT